MITVKSFVFGPFQENTYLLINENKEVIIVDPGFYEPHEQALFDEYIQEHGLKPVLLLNTHCHLDHVFGNAHIHRTYDLQPCLHPLEKPVLDHGPAVGLMYNLPFEGYMGDVQPLEHGQTLLFGNDSFEVLFVPGHSPGHVCFYHTKQRFLIAGDTLFHRSIGRTDLPGGNHADLLRSIREVLFALPDEVVVHSGHGPVTTIGEEKQENPFLQ
jgi:hydroxyacylglutathione hydrolase